MKKYRKKIIVNMLIIISILPFYKTNYCNERIYSYLWKLKIKIIIMIMKWWYKWELMNAFLHYHNANIVHSNGNVTSIKQSTEESVSTCLTI